MNNQYKELIIIRFCDVSPSSEPHSTALNYLSATREGPHKIWIYIIISGDIACEKDGDIVQCRGFESREYLRVLWFNFRKSDVSMFCKVL